MDVDTSSGDAEVEKKLATLDDFELPENLSQKFGIETANQDHVTPEQRVRLSLL